MIYDYLGDDTVQCRIFGTRRVFTMPKAMFWRYVRRGKIQAPTRGIV